MPKRLTFSIIATASLALLLLGGCSSGPSQPAGDKTACRYYQQWISMGGATTQFGNFTDLLDSAWRAAAAVPNSDANAIANGLSQPPPNDPAAQLAWDLYQARADAEGRLSPPDGWSDEAGQVIIDCDKNL